MTNTTSSQLNNLAQILVHNAGVTAGTNVLIHTHVEGAALAELTRTLCEQQGATEVRVITFDYEEVFAELRAHPDASEYPFDPDDTATWNWVVDTAGCVIQIRTDPDPDQVAPLSASYGRWYKQMWQARGQFMQRGVIQGELPWTLAVIPTQATANKLYPDLDPTAALAAYWDAVFAMTYADQPDPVGCLQRVDQQLQDRHIRLNELGITQVHITDSEGSNLTVGLSSEANWLGGSKLSDGATAIRHTPNTPTYEVYITPDWRSVTGTIRITKDVVVEGALVTGATLTFVDGRLTDVTADTGADALRSLTSQDTGAAQLGELALVGMDSPVAKTGQVFRSVIYDENAACHIAFGAAYLACFASELVATEEQRTALGINQSDIHHDVMISDHDTNVVAITATGAQVELIKGGHWTSTFL